MVVGLGIIILSFLLVGVLSFWAVRYTRRNLHQDGKKKYIAARNLLIAGIILFAGYIIFAKKVSYNIDLVISWILLASGCFFASGLAVLIGYNNEKN